ALVVLTDDHDGCRVALTGVNPRHTPLRVLPREWSSLDVVVLEVLVHEAEERSKHLLDRPRILPTEQERVLVTSGHVRCQLTVVPLLISVRSRTPAIEAFGVRGVRVLEELVKH